MFELKRVGTTVNFIVEYFIPYGSSWTSTFSHSGISEHDAQLMYAHLREVMEEKLRTVRREAYERGWKDKASKKPKVTWFSCEL